MVVDELYFVFKITDVVLHIMNSVAVAYYSIL